MAPTIYALSFFMTLLIEGLIALAFRLRGKGWLIFLLTNVITNPIAVTINILLVMVISLSPLQVLLFQTLIEIPVAVAEVLIYRKASHFEEFHIKHPVAYGITANAVSWLVGSFLADLILARWGFLL